MLGALLYLRLTSLKNQLVSRARRLRQPKYLLGALAGAAYVYIMFYRPLSGASGGRGASHAGHATNNLPMAAGFGDALPLVTALGALLLLVIMLLSWVLPSGKPGLRFTEAETAFLFSAPISRRTLINFKLLSSQISILLSSLFFTLIFNRWRFLGGNPLMHALGWWAVLSTLNLHFVGAALTISRLVESGVSPLRRRLAVLAVIGVAVAATLVWAWHDLRAPDADDVADTAAFANYVLGMLDHGVFGVLLMPFKWVLGPFLASDARTFLFALAPALLVIVAHYSWVLRMETPFEEASLALAEKRAALITAMREGKRGFRAVRTKGRAAPFHLADTGRPELAFLWKNLLSTAPYFNVRAFAIAAAVILVGSRWFLGGDQIAQAARITISSFSLIAGGYILLFGPHLARQDIRSDLPNADILKTYPLHGWQVLLGQLLTPVAILTGLVWLALLAAYLAVRPAGAMAAPSAKLAAAVGIAAITPFLVALQVLVLNGATLLFPAWFQVTRGQGGGGIEVMGQRLIFVFGQFLVVFLALLPGALLAFCGFGATWYALKLVGLIGVASLAGVVVAATLVLIVLAAEVWCTLWWLGERFERLDVSAELRP